MKIGKEQVQAFDNVMEFMKGDDQVYVIAGYAGAGKTTLAKKIAEEVGEYKVAFCALTGKAANVLREKGCENCDTIHGSIYSQSSKSEKRKEIEEEIAAAETDPSQDMGKILQLYERLESLRINKKEPNFILNLQSRLKEMDLVIVDEYSMLNDKIIDDLKQVSKKILFLGDPFQLPPVKEACSLEPDFFITEIHRQALNSAIIRASIAVREKRTLPFGSWNDFEYLPSSQVAPERYLEVDQIIVGKNNTRNSWNNRIREKLGFTGLLPHAGEKVICLKNNHAELLFNGMITKTTSTCYSRSSEEFVMNTTNHKAMRVWVGDIEGREADYDYRNKYMAALERFTYAYAITCHKSQGSEFDDLLVYKEPIGYGEQSQRWLYTAITRAKKKCTLVGIKR